MMKLHITPGSPYGRIARIVVIEKGLQDRVAIIPATTRTTDSPYYKVNPSGRVPFLERDDGPPYEDSALICLYLDSLDGKPTLHPDDSPQGWEMRRIEAMARSLLDGIAVWGREMIYRTEEMRSKTIMAHEATRALRIADLFEAEMANPVLTGPLNMAQIVLGCALNWYGAPLLCGQDWRAARPKLAAWSDKIAARPSFQATVPPPRTGH